METRFYQTQDLDLPRIAQALVLEYQARGFEAHQAGMPDQVIIQLKKESILRAITGFNKALGISLQKVNEGTLVKVGAQDWVDQLAVGAAGLAVPPLLPLAATGAVTQQNEVQQILHFIDQQIRQQQPLAQLGVPPGTS